MTLQSSGAIKMSEINAELGRGSTNTISLDSAENGTYATINSAASPKPSSSNPATMSEWYGYNHSYVAATWYGNRGIQAGGYGATQPNVDEPTLSIITYFSIASTGNASSFGNLTVAAERSAENSSGTRGVFGQGSRPGGYSNVMDYITIATTGNATDFGDATSYGHTSAGCSSITRGLRAGGYWGWPRNIIDYITIATTGNATDFGDLIREIYVHGGFSDGTKGYFIGGVPTSGAWQNTIEYVTFSSLGNTTDWADARNLIIYIKAASNATRALIAHLVSAQSITDIDSFVMASQSATTLWGNLTYAGGLERMACTDGSRCIFMGGRFDASLGGQGKYNNIEYMSMSSAGGGTDFGDLTYYVAGGCGVSGN